MYVHRHIISLIRRKNEDEVDIYSIERNFSNFNFAQSKIHIPY